MSRLWLLILAPALGAAALAALLLVSVWADLVFTVRAALPSIVLAAGLLGSALVYGGALLLARHHRQAQQQLAAAQARALDERRRFLRRLDHELKNPLMVIRAALANLPGPELPADGAAPLNAIELQTLRLARLTADLRKLADLEHLPLERTPIAVPELLQELLDLAQEQPQAATRTLTLTIPQVPWPLAPLHGDRDLLALAVYNLLDNALKFSRPGDRVELRAFEDGATLTIEVADTGPGIAPDDLPYVWDELYRGAPARSVAGSGIGLSLVRAIAEHHQGRAELRSRLGQGTVVSLRLPEHRPVTKR